MFFTIFLGIARGTSISTPMSRNDCAARCGSSSPARVDLARAAYVLRSATSASRYAAATRGDGGPGSAGRGRRRCPPAEIGLPCRRWALIGLATRAPSSCPGEGHCWPRSMARGRLADRHARRLAEIFSRRTVRRPSLLLDGESRPDAVEAPAPRRSRERGRTGSRCAGGAPRPRGGRCAAHRGRENALRWCRWTRPAVERGGSSTVRRGGCCGRSSSRLYAPARPSRRGRAGASRPLQDAVPSRSSTGRPHRRRYRRLR